MAPSAVLFDIDGTLLDSTYLHALAWRRAAVECGLEVPTSVLHRLIGMGSAQLLGELLGDAESSLAKAARDAHRRHFDALKPEIRPFAGTRELLAAVRERGPRVVLATSSSEHDLPALLAALGHPAEVDVVTSAADVDAAKPEPDVFAVAMERANVPPGRALAIGDAVWDVVAAGRAGVPCIGVLTGGISKAELTDAGAIAVYPDVAALLGDLDSGPLSPLWKDA